MKLKHTYEIMELDDQMMAVPVGDGAEEFHGILRMNQSAAAILELLKEDTTEEEIVAKLLEEYDSTEEELQGFVHGYLEQLKEAELVD